MGSLLIFKDFKKNFVGMKKVYNFAYLQVTSNFKDRHSDEINSAFINLFFMFL
jgi:hypothetical protein